MARNTPVGSPSSDDESSAKSQHIRFAPDILARLGEELNPNIDQGVLELVKNAYDADARTCRVEMIGTDQVGGTIRVVDDGLGMTDHDVADGWLVLGRSRKTTHRRTGLGRIPAGNKGLGRLAALRLGHIANLTTRPDAVPGTEFVLDINWDRYQGAALVEDVALQLLRRKSIENTTGTEITIRRLRKRVGRMEVKRLARALVLLADPFGDDPYGFRPELAAPEFDDLERLVTTRYFPDAEFHLQASVDERGLAQAKVLDWKGGELFSEGHEKLSVKRDGAKYDCPPAQFDLWVYILSAETFRLRSSSLAEVREWLGSFGGVHLYVNGLRVSPYGNPGNDWLNLNLRRVQDPENRPGTNTSIGRLKLEDPDGVLIEKTDRSGVIDSDVFTELHTFASDALEWMADRRQDEAEERRGRERRRAETNTQRQRRQVTEVLEGPGRANKEEVRQLFAQYDRSRDRQEQALKREVQLYRTLSTAGITAATFAHEAGGGPIKVIAQAIRAIETRSRRLLSKEDFTNRLSGPIRSIKETMGQLAVLTTATLRLLESDKRRIGRVDIHEVLKSVVATLKPFLDGRDVTVDWALEVSQPYLRGSVAALESVITNLLNNSLTAFEESSVDDRRIVISTARAGNVIVLEVADNGPGIEGMRVADIWLPGRTSRAQGTGLGLTIVRDSVTDLGGTVHAIPHGALGGATFSIELPLLGS